MDDLTAQRIHDRIDETHKLINAANISYAVQTKSIENLSEDVKSFIKKVDDLILSPQEGCMVKNKTKLNGLCTQVKNQWALIMIILAGILGIAWEVVKKK